MSYRIVRPLLMSAEFDGRPQVAPTGCTLKNNVVSAINCNKSTTIKRREQAPALLCGKYEITREIRSLPEGAVKCEAFD